MTKEHVDIDSHRRLVRKNADGEVLPKVHIHSDPMALAAAVSASDPYYWAADVLAGTDSHELRVTE